MVTVPGLPSAFGYIGREDNLRLRVRNSATGAIVAIEGRVLNGDGIAIPFADTLAPATDRSASTKLVRVGEGMLLNVSVRALAGSPRRGQTYVLVELVRGFTGDVIPLGVLIQGYVSEPSRRQWPGSLLDDATDGRGVSRTILGTDPAAGVEISETVPTAARWRLVALTATLLTDATVANRTPAILIDDGTNTVYQSGYNGSIAASGGAQISWGHGVGAFGSTSNGAIAPLPTELMLTPGYRIRSTTIALQAGDNWGAPRYTIEEWIEP